METLDNRLTRWRRGGQGGFTLIELLVVIAILGILAAIVIFNVTGVTNKGSAAACQTDLSTVQSASDAYYNANSKYPIGGAGTAPASPATVTIVSADLVPTYIHTWPSEATFSVGGGGTVYANCP
ncbi:MAG: type II secretion system protein [Candidatus Dormibacteria bacterium]